jgi:hypothetical protein
LALKKEKEALMRERNTEKHEVDAKRKEENEKMVAVLRNDMEIQKKYLVVHFTRQYYDGGYIL